MAFKRKTATAASDGDAPTTMVVLAEKRIARVYDFKGMPLVDVREIYLDKAGQAMPSRKGISLTLDQFKTLSAEAESISKCMEDLQSRPKAEASGAGAGAGAAAASAPKAAGGKAAGDEDAGEGLAGSELTIQLSDKRVARVYTFKGMVLVDLREMWTDAAGTLKPTKKGISLRLEQFQKLIADSAKIIAAMEGLKASAASLSSLSSAAGGAGAAAVTSSKGGAKAARKGKSRDEIDYGASDSD